MAASGRMTVFIREHQTVFVAVLVGLFLLELEIFAIAAATSGKKTWFQVSDRNGRLVYEVQERHDVSFDPAAFEKTFGPMSNFQVRRLAREVPFPFRAWFVAALGVPLGGMLILAFVVRAFVAIFEGDKRPAGETGPATPSAPESRWESILQKIGRLNIFVLGFFLFLVVIYLRYLLAKKQVEGQMELDKLRLQLEFDRQAPRPRMALDRPASAIALPPAQAPHPSSKDSPGNETPASEPRP